MQSCGSFEIEDAVMIRLSHPPTQLDFTQQGAVESLLKKYGKEIKLGGGVSQEIFLKSWKDRTDK